MENLKVKCPKCGKVWDSYEEMTKDKDMDWDMDYDEIVYFHKCKRSE